MKNGEYAVDDVTQCWEWTGEVDQSGEPVQDGTGAFAGKKVRARTSIFRKHRELTPGLWVFPDCGNQKCVNPEHQVARLPNPEEQRQATERKEQLLAERVERQRTELSRALPKTLPELQAYSKPGTTKLNGVPCQLWFGQANKYGYPVLPWIGDDGHASEIQVVHRIMDLTNRPRPAVSEEMVVRRLCKDKKCIRPEHLEWVSKASMSQPFKRFRRY